MRKKTQWIASHLRIALMNAFMLLVYPEVKEERGWCASLRLFFIAKKAAGGCAPLAKTVSLAHLPSYRALSIAYRVSS